MTAAEFILLAALAFACWTDLRSRCIPNWLTYATIAGCLAAAAIQSGMEGFVASLLGLVVCGGVMLLSWFLFDIGGGDVKLVTAIGAALGWVDGLQALMWTLTLAAVWMLSTGIWRDGLRETWRRVRTSAAAGTAGPTLSLAPAALVAVALVLAGSHGLTWSSFASVTSSFPR